MSLLILNKKTKIYVLYIYIYIYLQHLLFAFPNKTLTFSTYKMSLIVDLDGLGCCHWMIQSAMFDFVNVMSGLSWWELRWIRRNANSAPHVVDKWSQLNLSWGPLNFCIGSQSLVSICNKDCSNPLLPAS
jgi:hypothetical protein